jgi:DUF917 family protein
MVTYNYGIADFYYIAAGAAILASGGGGSYSDAVKILTELQNSGWQGVVQVKAYDGASNACVLALMGSPNAGQNLTLADVQNAIVNTLNTLQQATGQRVTCVIPVEIGPINSIVPLIAALMSHTSVNWVVDGDGAGRAVPELPQTTYSGMATLPASPAALANSASQASTLESATLQAPSAASVESLAGGIVSAFGSVSGIALWSSNVNNGYALSGNYIAGTLQQAWALGKLLLTAETPLSTLEVAAYIARITGRQTTVLVQNFYITSVSQSTTSASLDAGIIRLDNTPDPSSSTQTHTLYNLNENLLMYSSLSQVPDAIAPDSICYYSESTGLGFSNASDDLALYYDAKTGKSTHQAVSVIKVAALAQLYQAAGVVDSFATLLRTIGYAGQVPYATQA